MAVWDALGGFADAFFLYWEDVDLTYRWKRRGALVVEPGATVVHAVGATQGSVGKSLGYTYYNARNRMIFAARHLGVAGMWTWLRSSRAYAEELVARSGAADERSADEHRAAARRGARNGALRGAQWLLRGGRLAAD
jgi:GT2 family glycosyltransferase